MSISTSVYVGAYLECEGLAPADEPSFGEWCEKNEPALMPVSTMCPCEHLEYREVIVPNGGAEERGVGLCISPKYDGDRFEPLPDADDCASAFAVHYVDEIVGLEELFDSVELKVGVLLWHF